MLASRDSVVTYLTLKSDAGALQGAINASSIVGARAFFTEWVDVGWASELIIFCLTTSHSGTNPTMDIKLQYSPDKVHSIDSGDSFTQITTTDGLFLKKATSGFGKYIRVRIDIGGTASPTYATTMWLALKA